MLYPLLPHKRQVSLSDISAKTGLVFPHSARLRRSQYVRYARTSFLWAEVTTDKESVGPFVDQTSSTLGLRFSKDFQMSRLVPDEAEWRDSVSIPSWWRPDDVRASLGAGGQVGLEGWLEVLIHESSNAHATLYIQWTKG